MWRSCEDWIRARYFRSLWTGNIVWIAIGTERSHINPAFQNRFIGSSSNRYWKRLLFSTCLLEWEDHAEQTRMCGSCIVQDQIFEDASMGLTANIAFGRQFRRCRKRQMSTDLCFCWENSGKSHKNFLNPMKNSNTPLHQTLTFTVEKGSKVYCFSLLCLIILRTRYWPNTKDYCTCERFFMFLVCQWHLKSTDCLHCLYSLIYLTFTRTLINPTVSLCAWNFSLLVSTHFSCRNGWEEVYGVNFRFCDDFNSGL